MDPPHLPGHIPPTELLSWDDCLGAHTVGACHAERSGFEGAWTDDKLKFDNAYFKDLLNKNWSMETVWSPNSGVCSLSLFSLVKCNVYIHIYI